MSFIQFAESHGLMLRDFRSDGVWHRVPTTDKPKKRNGAYMCDGSIIVVQNWGTMQSAVVLKDGKASEYTKAVRKERIVSQEESYQKAAIEAKRELELATQQTHDYLMRKGFHEATGNVNACGELLIPMRDFAHYGKLNSLQRIAPDGSKKFLSGGRAKGSVLILGNFWAQETWFCEGYATGLSIFASLERLYRKARVVVCFSAGNMRYVATGQNGFVFADHDPANAEFPERGEAGQKAAQAIGLPWLMSDVVGHDANDDHMQYGLSYVAKKIVNFLADQRSRQ